MKEKRNAQLSEVSSTILVIDDEVPIIKLRKAFLEEEGFIVLEADCRSKYGESRDTEKVAMAISGHKTRSVVDRYNIVNEADLARAAQSLSAYFEEGKIEMSAHQRVHLWKGVTHRLTKKSPIYWYYRKWFGAGERN